MNETKLDVNCDGDAAKCARIMDRIEGAINEMRGAQIAIGERTARIEKILIGNGELGVAERARRNYDSLVSHKQHIEKLYKRLDEVNVSKLSGWQTVTSVFIFAGVCTAILLFVFGLIHLLGWQG